MQFEAAVVQQNGMSFAVLNVREDVLRNPAERENLQRFGWMIFGNMPIVLMGLNKRRMATFYGPTPLVKYLGTINPGELPFQRYNVE